MSGANTPQQTGEIMDRRSFVRTSAGAAVGLGLMGAAERAAAASSHWRVAADVLGQKYPFVLPPLGYANEAVEPVVDAMTMGIHHDKHHAAYVTNLNKALETQPALQGKTLRELLAGLSSLPDGVKNAVRNNGGGHANHAMFWTLLAPGGAKMPTGTLAAAITRDFGSTAACIAALKAAGVGQFGSGWTWLIKDSAGKLTVKGSANQDTPISDNLTPVLGVDVWEHAYYLKYQNRRADYLDAVLGALNWDVAGAAYAAK
jgi:Fe-Mn family superoxide dismutase